MSDKMLIFNQWRKRVRKFNDLSPQEKLEKIYSRAYNKCQDSIDMIMNHTQGNREELERFDDYLKFNEDMMSHLMSLNPNQDERELMETYGVHIHSRRMRNQ